MIQLDTLIRVETIFFVRDTLGAAESIWDNTEAVKFSVAADTIKELSHKFGDKALEKVIRDVLPDRYEYTLNADLLTSYGNRGSIVLSSYSLEDVVAKFMQVLYATISNIDLLGLGKSGNFHLN